MTRDFVFLRPLGLRLDASLQQAGALRNWKVSHSNPAQCRGPHQEEILEVAAKSEGTSLKATKLPQAVVTRGPEREAGRPEATKGEPREVSDRRGKSAVRRESHRRDGTSKRGPSAKDSRSSSIFRPLSIPVAVRPRREYADRLPAPSALVGLSEEVHAHVYPRPICARLNPRRLGATEVTRRCPVLP